MCNVSMYACIRTGGMEGNDGGCTMCCTARWWLNFGPLSSAFSSSLRFRQAALGLRFRSETITLAVYHLSLHFKNIF